MLFLQRHKKEIFGLILLFFSYFLLRLINLTAIPIFTDEAIYMRWAQIALHDSNWRFISLVDGKQPLFIWFAMVFQKFFDDPLVAGRLVSVLSGSLTLLGLLLLSYELFKNKTVSILTGFLYIIYPFAQVYDRMALMDGMVGTFAIWVLLFGVYLVRNIRLSTAYTLGFILSGSVLTKSSGSISAYLLPFTLLLFDFKSKNIIKRLFKWAALVLFAFAISQAMYSILRLSPFFHIIAEKNSVFIYTFQEWINHPFEFFFNNLQALLGWWVVYFNVFIVLLIVGLISKKYLKENLLLLSYFLIPLVIFALFAKLMYPRYLYPMTLSLLPIVGLGLNNLIIKIRSFIKNDNLTWILVPIFIIYPLFVSVQLLINPTTAKIADSDQSQYLRDWPAGWGVREVNSFLANESKSQKITLFTQGTFGLMPYSIELYQQGNSNLKVIALWPIQSEYPLEISDSEKQTPTYLLFYQPCSACKNIFEPPTNWPVAKVFQASLGNLALYKVLSK